MTLAAASAPASFGQARASRLLEAAAALIKDAALELGPDSEHRTARHALGEARKAVIAVQQQIGVSL